MKILQLTHLSFLLAFFLVPAATLEVAVAQTHEGGHANLGFALYGTDLDGHLYSIDPKTGNVKLLGKTADAFYRGLTYDPRSDKLYAWGLQDERSFLIAIDPHTAKGTNYYAIPPGQGLALDPKTGLFWTLVSDGDSKQILFAIDPINPARDKRFVVKNPKLPPTWNSGVGWATSLAFHPETGVLYIGFDNGTDIAFVATVNFQTESLDFVTGIYEGAIAISFEPARKLLYVLGDNQFGPEEILYDLNLVTRTGDLRARVPVNGAIAFAPQVPGRVD